jgi:hypothetical protein
MSKGVSVAVGTNDHEHFSQPRLDKVQQIPRIAVYTILRKSDFSSRGDLKPTVTELCVTE